MVCFQTKNPNLGKNFGASDWKMVIYFMAIGNILWKFGIFYDHSVHFSSFGIMHQNLATLQLGGFSFCFCEKRIP
jgi:hypothetical protein